MIEDPKDLEDFNKLPARSLSDVLKSLRDDEGELHLSSGITDSIIRIIENDEELLRLAKLAKQPMQDLLNYFKDLANNRSQSRSHQD